MKKEIKVAISAATISGNQGAAAMLHATIQQLSAKGVSQFFVFTVYPEADSALNKYKNVKIFPSSPKKLVTVLIPGAIIYKIAPFIIKFVGKNSGIKELSESNFQIDLAGISFADGRRPFLIYNIATLLPAIILGVPIVKFAQAMGPFKDSLNRFVASRFLPKINHIFARGAETRKAMDNIGLLNVSDAADIAFLFEPEKRDQKKAETFIKKNNLQKNKFIIVSPSRVLEKKAQALNIEYVSLMSQYIDWLIEKEQQPVVLIAHSIRENTQKAHNNDLLVVDKIYQDVKNKKLCIVPKKPLYAGELKVLISKSRLVIAARFHAMIASLSVGTPVIVRG